MNNQVPRWLLIEVGLTDGVFTEDGSAIVGRPDAHNSAVLNVGNGPPATITVNLTKRSNWEDIRQKLADERVSRASHS